MAFPKDDSTTDTSVTDSSVSNYIQYRLYNKSAYDYEIAVYQSVTGISSSDSNIYVKTASGFLQAYNDSKL